MKIQDVIFSNAILIDLKPQPKTAVITQMAKFLGLIHNIKDSDGLVQKILEREADISTGIGYGIAIPHARTPIVDHICMVAARCVEGIDFDAIDEQPVNLLFMLASPPTNADEHRDILSSLSKIMSYEEMRKKLLGTTDADSFKTALIDGENKYITP
ncbi:MAG: PTS sugar transporter subunit IIA [Chitinivibrionales bacterium]|nr:PTS sugar transporter subunit IIA [Chitinivibrionales bacterium]